MKFLIFIFPQDIFLFYTDQMTFLILMSPWDIFILHDVGMKWHFQSLCFTDHCPVETAGIPRAARVREFQTTPKRSCGRRPGNPTDAVPYAAIHRHRAWWLPGNNTYTVGSRPGFHHLPRFDQGLTFYYCICYFCTFTLLPVNICLWFARPLFYLCLKSLLHMKNGGEWCEFEIRANISVYAVYESNSSIGEM